MVMKVMVAVPEGDQFVEPLVFDLPSGMTELNDRPRGSFRLGESRHPGPIVGLDGVGPLFAYAFPHMGGLQ